MNDRLKKQMEFVLEIDKEKNITEEIINIVNNQDYINKRI